MMTPAQRRHFEDILGRRPFAPLPTTEDIRILLAEIARLNVALSAAVKAASDAAYLQLPAKRPRA